MTKKTPTSISPPLPTSEEVDISTESKIGVAIVDDHLMVAEGLARMISAESDFELVGVAASMAEAILLTEEKSPDVVLMDYHLPDGDGDEAAREILKRRPETKLLMLSGSGGSELLARAIDAGCAGFLSKNRPWDEVTAAVRAAARGELVMQADELAGLLGKLRGEANGEGLTTRELSVLRLLGAGCSTDAIASEMYLSPHTVRNHVRNILMKLGVHSKLAAVAVAMRDGVIAVDEI